MDYRIISADAAIGQIHVTYSDAGEDIATYAIDVPVIDGAFLTGDALAAEIQLRAPVWLLERKAAVAAATGFDTIYALVEPPATMPSSETAYTHGVPVIQSTTFSVTSPLTVL